MNVDIGGRMGGWAEFVFVFFLFFFYRLLNISIAN